jgi:hypothetical protein
MGLWAKSLRIFNAFCDNAKQSIRQVAHQTGFSKSSVHRLTQAMKGRDKHPESWWICGGRECGTMCSKWP